MSVSSASRVELTEVGMEPQIRSTLISSSRLRVHPGLFSRIGGDGLSVTYGRGAERQSGQSRVALQEGDPHLLLHEPGGGVRRRHRKQEETQEEIQEAGGDTGSRRRHRNQEETQVSVQQDNIYRRQLVDERVVEVVVGPRGAEGHQHGAVRRPLQGDHVLVNLVPRLRVHLQDLHVQHRHHGPARPEQTADHRPQASHYEELDSEWSYAGTGRASTIGHKVQPQPWWDTVYGTMFTTDTLNFDLTMPPFFCSSSWSLEVRASQFCCLIISLTSSLGMLMR
ncbi:hypothetical protein CRUP_024576 [Coryphaenoides rupestris]|nr:hypothetical protein CRUP_024576 [Coryphaenoides rupestris]